MLKRVSDDVLSKFFRLTAPSFFVEEPFCVSHTLWYRKFLWIGETGRITIVRQNFFVSDYRIFSRRNRSVFEEVPGFEKIYA